MILTLSNVREMLISHDVIVQSPDFIDPDFWVVKRDIWICLSNRKTIVIPAGYRYDMASVPKWLWSIFRPYNRGLLAFLIHDWLYVGRPTWVDRSFADNEMKIWLDRLNKNPIDNWIRFQIVRLFGWSKWNKFV